MKLHVPKRDDPFAVDVVERIGRGRIGRPCWFRKLEVSWTHQRGVFDVARNCDPMRVEFFLLKSSEELVDSAILNLCLPPFASWPSRSTAGSLPKFAVPAVTNVPGGVSPAAWFA
jgi:hypothetical protein